MVPPFQLNDISVRHQTSSALVVWANIHLTTGRNDTIEKLGFFRGFEAEN
jgi:hypothetical protein